MSEPLKDVLDPRIDEARIHGIWRRLENRRRPAAPWGIGALIFVASLAALLLLTRTTRPTPLALDDGSAPGLAESGSGTRSVGFADGSLVTLDPGTTLAPTRNDGERFELRLREGAARFEVRPGGPRQWVIDCGPAIVEVVGTVFRVEHRANGELVVDVERGEVRVRSASGATSVAAGERLVVPAAGETASAALVAPEHHTATSPEPITAGEAEEPSRRRAAVRAPEPAPPVAPLEAAEPRVEVPAPEQPIGSWTELATSGAYEDAWAALGPDGLEHALATEDADTLLMLADVARLSGHPSSAIAPLERLLGLGYHGDRAGLAALTLGRIHQDALHDPRAAAEALARARDLGVPHALGADLESRLVLAWLDARDPRALPSAQRYLLDHPSGPRAGAIRARLEARELEER